MIWAWCHQFKKQIAWGAGIVVVVGLAVYFVTWRSNEKEAAAGEAISSVAISQMNATGTRPDAAAAYLKVAASFPNTDAGTRAILLAGSAYFADGKFTQAQEQFQRFAREHRDSPFVGEALLGVASCLDAQGKTDEAATAYKSVIDRRLGDHVLLQAKSSLARIYEKQNKPDQARTLYEEITRSDPYGSTGNEAAMRLEELKAKFPSLTTPPVASVTNIMTLPTAPATSAPAPVAVPPKPAKP